MWITILKIAVIIIAMLVVGFFRLREAMNVDIVNLIAEAEKMAVPGEEKMKYVVGRIYTSLGTLAQTYFTKERIESIAQKLFNKIRAYAEEYKKRTKEQEKE